MSKTLQFPEFYGDGDITEDTVSTIKNWEKDWDEFYSFIEACFDTNYGSIKKDDDGITFVTGGWSCNELVIVAMEKNMLFMALFWEASFRGGKYIFRNVKGKKDV